MIEYIKSCPVCGRKSENNKLVSSRGKHCIIDIIQCQNCQLFYQKEYFSRNSIKEFYRDKYSFYSRLDSLTSNKKEIRSEQLTIKTHQKRSLERFGQILDIHIPKNSSVFDIGCGAAGAIEYLKKEKECYVEACEIDKIYFERLTELEIIGFNEFFEDLNIENMKSKFDFVLMGDVLEHILDPVVVLFKIKEILKPNGKLIITTPLAPNGLIEFSNKINFDKYDFEVAHFTIFNEISLKYLLLDICKFSKIIGDLSELESKLVIEK